MRTNDSPIYATAAPIYLDAGWTGVLPLPPRRKANPPSGFTGKAGVDPDAAQVARWRQVKPTGNIGLRMPDEVLGIDVDHYDKVKSDGAVVTKRGADELEAIATELGVALPETWVSSSRDLPSGVRLFRVPPGLRFQGELSDAIELLQRSYRYAVVWPSMNPDSDTRYRWHTPAGERSPRPPRVDELAELPPEWVAYCIDDSPPEEVRPEVKPRPVPVDAPERSGAVDTVMERPRPWSSAGRHPLALRLTMSLARLEHLGYPGAADAIDEIRDEFLAAVANEPTRKAEAEWDKLVNTARNRAVWTAPKRPILEYEEARQRGRDKRRAELEASVAGWIRRSGLRGGRHV